MEDILSPTKKKKMIASFLEIAVGQSADTATQFLQATSWRLEEALQLYYVGNEGGAIAATSSYSPPRGRTEPLVDHYNSILEEDSGYENAQQDAVRPPLPVIREALYGDANLMQRGYPTHEASPLVAFRNFDEEMRRQGIWGSDHGSGSAIDASRDNLASLYRPPFELMHQGSFEQAKFSASSEGKWLLVNLQSTKEFTSHMLNRDTWANEAVVQTIKSNFIFWQVYENTGEGRKVCTYYKLESIPVVLVIDPITGQKMRSWSGMVGPERLLEDVLPFLDGGPTNHLSLSHKRLRGSPQAAPSKIQDETNEDDEEVQRALVASLENMKDPSNVASKDKDKTNKDKEELPTPIKLMYPPLPEEPKGDSNLLCRVGFRLPDGSRVQRNFFRTDPIQLLWSFCASRLKEAEVRPLRLSQAIPGATRTLDYGSKLTFEDSDLSNSMVSVTWE